jgi:hypothetical protein
MRPKMTPVLLGNQLRKFPGGQLAAPRAEPADRHFQIDLPFDRADPPRLPRPRPLNRHLSPRRSSRQVTVLTAIAEKYSHETSVAQWRTLSVVSVDVIAC